MYEYKVLPWRFDGSNNDDLENTLNSYAKDGWQIKNIINNLTGSGNILYNSLSNNVTFILERSK